MGQEHDVQHHMQEYNLPILCIPNCLYSHLQKNDGESFTEVITIGRNQTVVFEKKEAKEMREVLVTAVDQFPEVGQVIVQIVFTSFEEALKRICSISKINHNNNFILLICKDIH